MGGQWLGEGMPSSNLQCFLDCTTPTVETHILPKTNGRLPTDAWHHAEMDSVEYFNLADLWEQYYEWSAYGAGATVQLPGGDRVVQYYVPYLSGMQLYTNKVLTASRSFGEDNGMDLWSDDEDNEKMSRSWSSTSDESLFNCDVLWSNRKRPGHLYFEFFEVGSPYGRVPLIDKVYELSQGFPGLTSLKSAELSPVSWMSVAWYPIYHIPYQRSVKDLSACFLTYHTISSSFQDHGLETMTTDCCHPVANGKQNGHMDKKSNTVSLPPFGLAAHKIQGSLWTNPMTGDRRKMDFLFSAADSWLKQLGVQHHDFNFFITHPM
ncbi:uncharacterized protein LOC100277764 [Zea mays]|uniref:DUF789 family protein n=1 Tax=Zea mays TaxID=4577 RepID=B4FY71_MAIZE|nr:uncharacterized protein LOC100277764 [Zea mays]ACF87064.1 unknown [Zea mays]ACG45832.1 hypothetical protein [Zea mays]ONM05527.1 hypothetical protein ZEAMMB73_Zm00001d032603 [Zea mays]|eukprot:NP_001145213.1 uncharacterized protein LOC100277764 [Zea mays]